MTENDFLEALTKPVQAFFKLTHLAWVWIYNIAYFFFVFKFLHFKKHFKKQTKIIEKILYLLVFIDVVCFVIAIATNSLEILTSCYTFIFLPTIIILTLICFYFLFKTPEPTKYYILIGSFILFVSSLLGTLAVDFGLVFESKETGYLSFYIGLIVENIFFSLGLGFRQKLIINERNEANKKLIVNLRENETLKEEVNQQLLEKIDVLNEQIQLREQIDDLKLTALRSQMNPHFMFNALNSIKLYIINNEKKNATYYLNKFSKLMRRILEASAIKETSLKEELETTQLYMAIENIRFSNEINFKVFCNDESLKSVKVPPLLLQPFLENALWHGLSSKKNDKKIEISIDKTDANYLQITIEDNGIGRKAAANIKAEKFINRKSLGMEITKDRLSNFVKNYKNNYQILFDDLMDDSKNPTGTKVILKIPLF